MVGLSPIALHDVMTERIDVRVAAVVNREADGIEGAAHCARFRVETRHPMSVQDPHVRRIESQAQKD